MNSVLKMRALPRYDHRKWSPFAGEGHSKWRFGCSVPRTVTVKAGGNGAWFSAGPRGGEVRGVNEQNRSLRNRQLGAVLGEHPVHVRLASVAGCVTPVA